MRRILLAVLLTACSTPMSAPEPAPLLACQRTYRDGDQVLSVCYDKCPADMEAYARALQQSFSRVGACNA